MESAKRISLVSYTAHEKGNTTDEILKSCVFNCSGKLKSLHYEYLGIDKYCIECSGCKTRSPETSSEKNAILYWNMLIGNRE